MVCSIFLNKIYIDCIRCHNNQRCTYIPVFPLNVNPLQLRSFIFVFTFNRMFFLQLKRCSKKNNVADKIDMFKFQWLYDLLANTKTVRNNKEHTVQYEASIKHELILKKVIVCLYLFLPFIKCWITNIARSMIIIESYSLHLQKNRFQKQSMFNVCCIFFCMFLIAFTDIFIRFI